MATKMGTFLESLVRWTLFTIAIFGVAVYTSAFVLTMAQLGATLLGVWP
jgi:hypothetical protein